MSSPSEATLNSDHRAFFRTIYGSRTGWLFAVGLPPKSASNLRPYQVAVEYPNKLVKGCIVDEFIRDWVDSYNLYYPVNLANTNKSRRSGNMSESTMVYADLDTCDPKLLKLRPTLVIETSPGRWHALWLLEKPVSKFVAAELSHRIAKFHEADGCDKSGWDIAQILRIPGTYNYNRLDEQGRPSRVLVVEHNKGLYRPSDFNAYPEVRSVQHRLTGSKLNLSTDSNKNYDDLDLQEQCRIDLYTELAVEGELDRLETIAELQDGETFKYHKRLNGNYTGEVTEFGWSWGCVWVSRGLIELANAPWNAFTVDQAKELFFENAPRDDDFTDDTLRTIWKYSVNVVADKEVPYREYPKDLEAE